VFIGGLAMLRFIATLPELLQLNMTKTLEESTMLIRVEGMTHYQLLIESHTSLSYWLVEGICLTFSLILVSFILVWLKTRIMWALWAFKFSILLAMAVFGV
jgi:hypothetical protein